jgi:hypothetical protein
VFYVLLVYRRSIDGHGYIDNELQLIWFQRGNWQGLERVFLSLSLEQ